MSCYFKYNGTYSGEGFMLKTCKGYLVKPKLDEFKILKFDAFFFGGNPRRYYILKCMTNMIFKYLKYTSN